MKTDDVVLWFCHPDRRGPLPFRDDGSVDYEMLCAEFSVEGVPVREIEEQYNRLPANLKRLTTGA